ncbi:MAG: type II toxin-antitoxin system HicB family antitoxin [Bacteroidales bacterium]|nr:MAG: type II toxin-antitoxin system HicB family antitoxin [Bacteroidales bacterium]
MNKINVILESGKDGYGVMFENIPNVFSFGETVDKAKANAYEALRFHIESLKEDNLPIPKILKGNFELVFHFDTVALLNQYQGIFTKSALSKITGINASQLSQYANGFKKPRKQQVQRIEKGLHSLANDLGSVHLV